MASSRSSTTTTTNNTNTTNVLRFLRKPLRHNCAELWMNNIEIDIERSRAYAHLKMDDAYDTVINESRKVAKCSCAMTKKKKNNDSGIIQAGPVMYALPQEPVNTNKTLPMHRLPVPNGISTFPQFKMPAQQQHQQYTFNRAMKRQFTDIPVVVPVPGSPVPNGGKFGPPPKQKPKKTQTPFPRLPPPTRKNNNNISGVPCPQLRCNLIFTNIYDYYAHLSSSSHTVTPLRCPIKNCRTTISTFIPLQMNRHTAKKHPNLPAQQWQCKRCSSQCNSWGAQVYHNFQNHLGGKWWCSNGCGFSAGSKRANKEHEETCKGGLEGHHNDGNILS